MNHRLSWPLLLLLGACGSESAVEFQQNVDTFAQAPNNDVDILWVIDDSNSMLEEQETLADGFTSFAAQLEQSGTDFHIGVITTSFDYDMDNRGVLIGDPPYLTARDDYQMAFADRAQVGVEGSDKEKGLEAASFALSPIMTAPGGANEGFVRDEAQLLVVFVSDEEDCSDNGALEGEPAASCYTELEALTPTESFIEDLRDLKAEDEMVQVGAIIGLEDSSCEDVWPAQRYARVAALTGGLLGDICQNDWSNLMGDLGLNATGVRLKFQLSKAAQPDTLVVHVDDVESTDWTYDENTWFITFEKNATPPRGSTITAEYSVDPGRTEPVFEETTQ